MTEQPHAGSGAGRGITFILVAAIAMAAMAVFVKNLDAFIDSVSFYVNISVVAVSLSAAVLVCLLLWVQGHRLYAQSKGYAPLVGLLLGFFFIAGLVVLLALPPRKPSVEAEASSSESEGEEQVPGGEQQGD